MKLFYVSEGLILGSMIPKFLLPKPFDEVSWGMMLGSGIILWLSWFITDRHKAKLEKVSV